ncbi:MAG TPA: hypothetical protein VFL04_00120, partial [Rectinemataceae bacterium]|nr:hypothetical protein [Rectinemataceae bacterium]
MDRRLPEFVSPMLAVMGQPFDSPEFFFEFKWDGFRAAAYVEGGSCRLVGRRGLDLTKGFLGLPRLASLGEGLVLDGELVAFVDGRPDFESVLGRGRPGKAASLSFIAFDLLYLGYESLMDRPFSERRARLEELMAPVRAQELLLSEGLGSQGKALYAKACELGLEGVMAKRSSSAYAPGRRSPSWLKFKRRLEVQLAVIGYIDKGGRDFQCLLVAGSGLPGEEEGSPLRYVGRVGGGFTERMRERLNGLLRERPRPRPLVACPEKGRWVEPGLYCRVSYVELSSGG